MKGSFDVIFCRNVVIYFDKETKDQLFKRYCDILAPRGHLFLGHSESMGKEHNEFKNLGKTMYQKVADE
jgi:chemotaxis protein methyltransferase CheR